MSSAMPKEGKRYRYMDQLFWARNGLIQIEDQRDGSHKTVSMKEFAKRAFDLNRQISHMAYSSERVELERGLNDAMECLKEARAQGDPMNPAVAHQVAKDNRTIGGMMDGGAARLTAPTPNRTIFIPNVGNGTLIEGHKYPKDLSF